MQVAQQNSDVNVHWRSFELRPDPVPLLDPQGDYLTAIWRDHVYPLAHKMNLPLKLPRIQPRSRLAHEAAKWAGTHNSLTEYTLSLFKAFFREGLDISDTKVLAQLAIDLELDADELLAALDSKIFTDAVVADEDVARHIGVNAVPAFVVNDRIIAAGVQTPERLLSLLSMKPL